MLLLQEQHRKAHREDVHKTRRRSSLFLTNKTTTMCSYSPESHVCCCSIHNNCSFLFSAVHVDIGVVHVSIRRACAHALREIPFTKDTFLRSNCHNMNSKGCKQKVGAKETLGCGRSHLIVCDCKLAERTTLPAAQFSYNHGRSGSLHLVVAVPRVSAGNLRMMMFICASHQHSDLFHSRWPNMKSSRHVVSQLSPNCKVTIQAAGADTIEKNSSLQAQCDTRRGLSKISHVACHALWSNEDATSFQTLPVLTSSFDLVCVFP